MYYIKSSILYIQYVLGKTKTVFCVHNGKINVMSLMGEGKMETFCQVYLALAKCHPQSREGVLRCFPE